MHTCTCKVLNLLTTEEAALIVTFILRAHHLRTHKNLNRFQHLHSCTRIVHFWGNSYDWMKGTHFFRGKISFVGRTLLRDTFLKTHLSIQAPFRYHAAFFRQSLWLTCVWYRGTSLWSWTLDPRRIPVFLPYRHIFISFTFTWCSLSSQQNWWQRAEFWLIGVVIIICKDSNHWNRNGTGKTNKTETLLKSRSFH